MLILLKMSDHNDNIYIEMIPLAWWFERCKNIHISSSGLWVCQVCLLVCLFVSFYSSPHRNTNIWPLSAMVMVVIFISKWSPWHTDSNSINIAQQAGVDSEPARSIWLCFPPWVFVDPPYPTVSFHGARHSTGTRPLPFHNASWSVWLCFWRVVFELNFKVFFWQLTHWQCPCVSFQNVKKVKQ